MRHSSSFGQSKNPVSLRLYKVLGTRFDDEPTREALQTLSELYTTASKGKEIARDDDPDDDAPKPAQAKDALLKELVPGESAARARKHLRKDMESKLAEGSRAFLQAFAEVDQKLDGLQAHVAAMRVACDEAEGQLKLTDDASRTLLERASNLRDERNEVESKRSIVTLFLSRFTLSDEEAEAMTSRDVPIGSRFFAAMDKTQRIRDDCRVLMAGEDGPTQAGLDIMSSTSTRLEAGYDKILRWCTYEFTALRDTHIEVAPTLREAVRRLRARPELLTSALTTLAQTRSQSLMNAFLAALTRGGPGGMPRPIELHAHDPLRYVGDMLAWVHQTIAAEREFMEGLFGVGGDGRMVGSVRRFNDGSEEEGWIRELMDLGVSKLCVPLKVRVQQTIRSQESCIVSYKITNLLQFYMLTMQRTISEEALLSKTLQEIMDIAYQVFYDAVDNLGRSLSRNTLDFDDPSLTPPLAILDRAQILREVMTVYQSSLAGDEDEQDERLITDILDALLDPAVDMCLKASEDKRALRPQWDREVFVLNCLTYLEGVLEPFSFTSKKAEALQGIIREHIDALTDEHYHDIMVDAGLYEAAHTCENPPTDEPLSRIPSTRPSDLQAALHSFALWLSGLEVVESSRLAQLAGQRMASEVHRAALRRMARAYQSLCAAVRRPENRYEAASTLLGGERPFGQVHLLWQIFGFEEDEDRGE
ncbi:oligomeric Golgi complex subunit 6 [Schizophyllum amplum]|uniref:Conserved oligomeric Golgi complex subunit 6 n=1 Tax=Schizophyllum amplum TaxID=97359 RepID=A0A550C977_9AGAR|nr:oligomeric Golgi complex subunit 6 [Auriculariopsis ampla]